MEKATKQTVYKRDKACLVIGSVSLSMIVLHSLAMMLLVISITKFDTLFVPSHTSQSYRLHNRLCTGYNAYSNHYEVYRKYTH
jgi:hypothetical protein